MAFPLQQLEQHISDDFLLKGEQLFEQGEVQALRELERHLWTAQVAQDYEVEVKITPSRVSLTSCECPDFMTHGSCGHVAATLLALRKHIQQNLSARTEQAKPKSKQRLTTRGVLKNIEEEELKEFVRQYASRDRNFALALKARFAGIVEFSNDKGKYQQVLDETIRSARKKDRSISYRGMQTLIRVTDELLNQADAALVQAYFRTVVLIAQSIIERLTPVLRKTGQYQESARTRIQQSFQLMEQVLGLQPPPALVEEIWQYASEESKKVTYRINEIIPQFYRLLMQVSAQLNKSDELLQLFDALEMQSQFSARNYTSLLIHKIEVLEQLGQSDELEQLIRANQHNVDLVLHVLQRAIKREELTWAKNLADEILAADIPTANRERIEDIRLEIAEQESDDETIKQYAENRLLATYKIRYFEMLQTQSKESETWLSERSRIISNIMRQAYSAERRDIVAHIYLKEQDWESLLQYLVDTRSLDMLSNFTKPLLPSYRKQIYALYEDLVMSYLSNHYGRTAAKRVGEKVVRLRRIGAHRIAEALLRKIREEHSDRASLMDELSVL